MNYDPKTSPPLPKNARVLVTGVTGYIGGSVATRLMDRGFRVVGLTRRPETLEPLRVLGVEPLLGSLETAEPLTAAATEADAVINAASSDNAFAVVTLLDALRGSGKPFIHTSGSSVAADKAAGALGESVYDEDSRPEPVPEKRGRALIDQLVLDAAADGVRSVVICPTMIYGVGLGLKKDSVQVPLLERLVAKGGTPRRIGAGENRWSNVGIEDLADLYLLALTRAEAGTFAFAENGEATMGEVVAAIGRRRGFTGEPAEMDQDAAIGLLGAEAAMLALGSNSRVRARVAREAWGWSPSRDDLLASTANGG